ncbi:MAG: zinc ribbon domain-containing protein [Nitrospinae bacterium]|nr:zinc ribbon domain-containing protein [Nitrospinota bacterium]
MRCPSCGFENPEGMKFCGKCATPLGLRCPQCGFENPVGFAFCGQCATALTDQTSTQPPQLFARLLQPRLGHTPTHLAEKILSSKADLEGERKQVTVLFADLKGSLELLADRDPIEEGLNVLAEALATAHQSGERYYKAELYRLKGELLLRMREGERERGGETAEECFQQALNITRRQQAKSLELRAAMSLSRLWQRQGKRAEARQLLAEIYSWFTEGFDTADLQEAKALLEELA